MAAHLLGQPSHNEKGQRRYTQNEVKNATKDVEVLLADNQADTPIKHIAAAIIITRRLYNWCNELLTATLNERLRQQAGGLQGFAGMASLVETTALPVLSGQNSSLPIDGNLVAVMHLTSRLYEMLRGELETALNAWELTNPELISRMLVGGFLHTASKPVTIEELREGVRDHLIPCLKIFSQIQKEVAEDVPLGEV